MVDETDEPDEFNRADNVDDGYDDDDDGGGGNRIAGGVPRDVLDYIARSIVDDPDAVEIEADERRGRIELRLHVAPDDMGKVIGKRGRVVQAMRTLVRAAAARDDLDADVDVVD